MVTKVHLINRTTGAEQVLVIERSEDTLDALEQAKREGFEPRRTERVFDDEGVPRGYATRSAFMRA